MIQGKRISVIVSVFNEEKTVGGVLAALAGGKLIDEVICVDDGSTDGTAGVIDQYQDKVKIIHFAKNKGKGAAMAQGVKKAKGEVVVFCDSDLLDLQVKDIEKMVDLLISSGKRVVLGEPQGKTGDGHFFSALVGERAYYRSDLLPIAGNFVNSRLGVETYLNSQLPEWESIQIGAYHLEKYEKMPLTQATIQYIREGVEIVKTKAKINGWWNEEWNEQLEALAGVKDWVSLEKGLRKIKNTRLVRLLRKYTREYVSKIQNILGVD